MSEKYYAVERTDAYLAHLKEAGTGGGSLTIKDHKYVARVPKAGGGYRYFYSNFEVDAYKRARAKGWGEGKSAEAAPSDTRSLREKWEERRGMLSSSGSGSGKGSGGKGGSGKGKGSSGKGGSGKSSGSTAKVGKTALISAGARVYKGPSTGEGLTPEQMAKKKKKVKKTTSKSANTRITSAYTPYVIRRGR